jgi:hypothetical protein
MKTGRRPGCYPGRSTDDVPTIAAAPATTRSGDIWAIRAHRVICRRIIKPIVLKPKSIIAQVEGSGIAATCKSNA